MLHKIANCSIDMTLNSAVGNDFLGEGWVWHEQRCFALLSLRFNSGAHTSLTRSKGHYKFLTLLPQPFALKIILARATDHKQRLSRSPSRRNGRHITVEASATHCLKPQPVQ